MISPVRAVLKTMLAFGDGASADHSLEGYAPHNPKHFGFNAQILISEEGNDLADSFDLVVCSPSWLAEQVAAGQWVSITSTTNTSTNSTTTPSHPPDRSRAVRSPRPETPAIL
jgi:hypothetical protein